MNNYPISATLKPSARDRWSQFLNDLRQGTLRRVLTPYRSRIRRIMAAARVQEAAGGFEKTAAAIVCRAQAGESTQSMLEDVFALTAAAAHEWLGLEPRPVQLAAALAMQDGYVAEMATGEGKTLAAVFPAVLNGLKGRGVHVMTANDYLAARDAAWMGPLYRLFGLSVGVVTQETPADRRREAYAASITYLTARQAGFDFLRDAIAMDRKALRQRAFHFALVDEADFLLIDEARIPMVIAGHEQIENRDLFRLNQVVAKMRGETHFQVDKPARNAWFTDAGLARLESRLGRGDLFSRRNRKFLAAAHTVLHARTLLRRDVDYINGPDGIELVDACTGRTALDRRWPDGIHQAVEIKEGFPPAPWGRILGSITVQHLMKLYPRLAGMTATAVAAADELYSVYGLRVAVIPPHHPCRRVDEPDRIFRTRSEKYSNLVDAIRHQHERGRPVLVGTATVAESEMLAGRIREQGIQCRVLNARHPAREAEIISRAGCAGAVTIATNMAGRGVDIRLGGGDAREAKQIQVLGGLMVLGTCRHESRRIDDQLRGRAGRQGDPGGSCFFLSLEDDLMQRFGIAWPVRLMHRGGAPGDNRMAHRIMAHAQRRIEGRLAEARRILRDYSVVLEIQRRKMRLFRDGLLEKQGSAAFIRECAAAHGRSLEISSESGEAVRYRVLFYLDCLWSEHLERLRDLKEGVHLSRLGGRSPLQDYEREAARLAARLWRRLEGAVLRAVCGPGGGDGLQALPPRNPAETWTYLISDDPFKGWKLDFIAQSHIGTAAMTPLVILAHLPIILILALLRRLLQRSDPGKGRPGE